MSVFAQHISASVLWAMFARQSCGEAISEALKQFWSSTVANYSLKLSYVSVSPSSIFTLSFRLQFISNFNNRATEASVQRRRLSGRRRQLAICSISWTKKSFLSSVIMQVLSSHVASEVLDAFNDPGLRRHTRNLSINVPSTYWILRAVLAQPIKP